VLFIGPHQVRVLARVDIDDGLGGGAVKSLIREIEDALCRSSPYIVRVDVVPDGGRPPASSGGRGS